MAFIDIKLILLFQLEILMVLPSIEKDGKPHAEQIIIGESYWAHVQRI